MRSIELTTIVLLCASILVMVAHGADNGPAGLINWNTYTSMFNKHYSSLTQQLVRQKLFMSKVMLVFLVATKYRASQSSYFLAINRYSDLTPEEERRKLSGESRLAEEEDEEQPLSDDGEVERILKETLLERKLTTHWESEEANKRSKRSTIEESYFPKQCSLREITMDDLVRLPNKSSGLAAGLKMKLVVPSNNPDYQPVDVTSFGGRELASSCKQQTSDIPSAQAKLIEESTWSLSESKVSSIVQKLATTLLGDQCDEQRQLVERKREDRLLIDWRRSGCIAPPVDQGECASCYAISSMSFIEWAFCMNQGRVLTPLSAQYLISCGPQFRRESGGKYEFYGCEKGHTRQAMNFIKDYGVELEANLPYLARNTACPIDEGTPLKQKGYIRPNVRPTVRMWPTTGKLDKALELNPIIVSFKMPENFLSFAGGIIDSCSRDTSLGGHAMLLVGMGLSEENEAYLLVKNSMGPDWGEQGYFKLKRSAVEECVKEFIWPRLSFPSKKAMIRRARAYEARSEASE